MILIHPDQAPELLFEPPYSFKTFRTPEQLPVIEDRLCELGFEIERNGNVVTYRLLHGDKWMVLADPRTLNEFEFRTVQTFGQVTNGTAFVRGPATSVCARPRTGRKSFSNG